MILRYLLSLFGLIYTDCGFYTEVDIHIDDRELTKLVRRHYVRTGTVPMVGQEFLLPEKYDGSIVQVTVFNTAMMHLSHISSISVVFELQFID